MSRSGGRNGFFPVTAKQNAEQHEQGLTMQERHPVPAAEMVRIPGLYRRWELPEVLKNHHAYRIEDAGAHQDGTPLLAVYAACDGDDPPIPARSSASQVSAPARSKRSVGGPNRAARRRPCS
jgi:hypothetical protein